MPTNCSTECLYLGLFHQQALFTPFHHVGMRNLVSLDPKFSHFGVGRVVKISSWTCFCKRGGESGRESFESKLETEIFEFMKGRENLGAFPTKAELVNAGRWDLVEAIVKRGGWFSMGWEFEEEEMEIENVGNERETSEENGEMGSGYGDVARGSNESVERFGEGSSSVSTSFSHSPSFSGSSSEMRDEGEDTGVEGILNRLEKQRNLIYSEDLEKQSLSRYNSDDWLIEAYQDVASEVSFGESQFHETGDAPNDRIIEIKEGFYKVLDEKGDTNHSDLRTRLQHMELELASTLYSLRSKSEKLIPKEDCEIFNNLQKFSDALEFQETDIMNAKDSLRSIRAKLAVLQAKMILATIDSRKKIYEKQKKINGARRALQILRDISVVWPNSASEVFLVGSFDGWSTQRRMMKSSNGIFSVDLKLYPGKYEIKFIVDGVWKVDPLRPIAKNRRYENNLFIVT